jgi:WD40 repeat protein
LHQQEFPSLKKPENKCQKLEFANLPELEDKYREILSSVKFSTDGEMIAASNYNGCISIWSVNDWHLIKNFHAHNDQIYDLEFSPDSKMIASVSRDTDRRIALWDIASMIRDKSKDIRPIETFKGHTSAANQVKFQTSSKPNNIQLIASTSDDNTVRLWYFSHDDNNSPEIDKMLMNSCKFLENYFSTNKSRNSRRNHKICDEINLESSAK